MLGHHLGHYEIPRKENLLTLHELFMSLPRTRLLQQLSGKTRQDAGRQRLAGVPAAASRRHSELPSSSGPARGAGQARHCVCCKQQQWTLLQNSAAATQKGLTKCKAAAAAAAALALLRQLVGA